MDSKTRLIAEHPGNNKTGTSNTRNYKIRGLSLIEFLVSLSLLSIFFGLVLKQNYLFNRISSSMMTENDYEITKSFIKNFFSKSFYQTFPGYKYRNLNFDEDIFTSTKELVFQNLRLDNLIVRETEDTFLQNDNTSIAPQKSSVFCRYFPLSSLPTKEEGNVDIPKSPKDFEYFLGFSLEESYIFKGKLNSVSSSLCNTSAYKFSSITLVSKGLISNKILRGAVSSSSSQNENFHLQHLLGIIPVEDIYKISLSENKVLRISSLLKSFNQPIIDHVEEFSISTQKNKFTKNIFIKLLYKSQEIKLNYLIPYQNSKKTNELFYELAL